MPVMTLRLRCRNVVNKLKVRSLNINGIESCLVKWTPVENDISRERDVGIIMLSETRLMNEESVPDIAGYCNVQSNRRGSSGKSTKR